MVKKGKRRRWRGKECPKGRYDEMDIEKQTGTRGRQRDRDLERAATQVPSELDKPSEG